MARLFIVNFLQAKLSCDKKGLPNEFPLHIFLLSNVYRHQRQHTVQTDKVKTWTEKNLQSAQAEDSQGPWAIARALLFVHHHLLWFGGHGKETFLLLSLSSNFVIAIALVMKGLFFLFHGSSSVRPP